MVRSVFGRVIQNRLRSLIWWSLAAAGLTVTVLAFYPVIRDNPELQLLFSEMPPEMLALFAGGVADLVSPPGYLNSQLMATMVPLMLLIYAIGFGTQEVAGEEERGTAELVLGTPLPRLRFLLEKFAAMVVTTSLLGLAFWLVLWLGDAPSGLELGAGPLAAAIFAAVLMAVAYGTLSLAIGAATGRRPLASGIGAALAVGGYLLYTLAPLTERLENFQSLSPFYYYLGADPLTEGLSPEHSLVLLLATLVLLAVALATYPRRDLAL